MKTFKLFALSAMMLALGGSSIAMAAPATDVIKHQGNITIIGHVADKTCTLIADGTQTVDLGTWNKADVQNNRTPLQLFTLAFNGCNIADIEQITVSGAKATQSTDLLNTLTKSTQGVATNVAIQVADAGKKVIDFSNATVLYQKEPELNRVNLTSSGDLNLTMNMYARLVHEGSSQVTKGDVSGVMDVLVEYK